MLIKKGYEYRFNIEDNVTIIKSESLFYNKNHNKFEKENYDLGTVSSNNIWIWNKTMENLFMVIT